MAVKLKIKKGDKVVVTTGRDKGKSGEVLAVFPKDKPPGAGCEYGEASPEANPAKPRWHYQS